MASLMFFRACAVVRPWLMQPGRAGTVATHQPSSSFSIRTLNRIVELHGARRLKPSPRISESKLHTDPIEPRGRIASKVVLPDNEVITCCRIGHRSSHTRFVLKYLLGYPDVRNYDGSWTEWGNFVRTPIEKA